MKFILDFSNRYLFKYIFFSLLLCLILNHYQAYGVDNKIGKLYSSKKNRDFYEIGKIQFIGNKYFSESYLLTIISSQETSRSIPHKILEYYYDNVQNNRAAPKTLNKHLKTAVDEFKDEIKYFDGAKADDDVLKIAELYNQNGFHRASVYFSFSADLNKELNMLTFHISEDSLWKVSSIVYIGLDSLPTDLKNAIESKKKVKPNSIYNENAILNEINSIYRILADNGYYYAYYNTPTISVDTTNFQDSITIEFNTGKRQRIYSFIFIDSLKGQNPVGNDMILRQLDFEIGDWYSYSKLDKTESNLISLGTFERVRIDTSSSYRPITDTTLSYISLLEYRKQQEYGISFFTNRTIIDNFWNAGIEASYFHRNVFGAAQVFNPFVRVAINNVSEAFEDYGKAQFEILAGINFSQPLIWTIDRAKVGGSAQFFVSQKTINREFKINTISLPVRFPINFGSWTYFNSASVDFSLERQAPQNFNEAFDNAMKNAKNIKDTLEVQRMFWLYGNLDEYVNSANPILTSSLLGFSLLGDTRDNPFSPTSGYFVAFTADGMNPITMPFKTLAGIAKFIRLQFTHYWFWSSNQRNVYAMKIRAGHIFWFDRANSYVPFERQFFAGGANSLRGWPSRRLRYDNQFYQDMQTNEVYNFAQDFIGNLSILEGSFEYRYKFPRFSKLGASLADIVSQIGITTFIDWGNAFNWLLLVDEEGNYLKNYKLIDYIEGTAIDAGLGLRYETPVGPFRIDFAWRIYDPTDLSNKWIFKRPDSFRGLQFHIGLGHAF